MCVVVDGESRSIVRIGRFDIEFELVAMTRSGSVNLIIEVRVFDVEFVRVDTDHRSYTTYIVSFSLEYACRGWDVCTQLR